MPWRPEPTAAPVPSQPVDLVARGRRGGDGHGCRRPRRSPAGDRPHRARDPRPGVRGERRRAGEHHRGGGHVRRALHDPDLQPSAAPSTPVARPRCSRPRTIASCSFRREACRTSRVRASLGIRPPAPRAVDARSRKSRRATRDGRRALDSAIGECRSTSSASTRALPRTSGGVTVEGSNDGSTFVRVELRARSRAFRVSTCRRSAVVRTPSLPARDDPKRRRRRLSNGFASP